MKEIVWLFSDKWTVKVLDWYAVRRRIRCHAPAVRRRRRCHAPTVRREKVVSCSCCLEKGVSCSCCQEEKVVSCSCCQEEKAVSWSCCQVERWCHVTADSFLRKSPQRWRRGGKRETSRRTMEWFCEPALIAISAKNWRMAECVIEWVRRKEELVGCHKNCACCLYLQGIMHE